MKYSFDEILVRRGSNSYKWDSDKNQDVLPMWVADMDFKTAPPVIDALALRVQHGVFGYTRVPDTFYEAIISWFGRRHHFTVERDWILFTTGVVPALSAVIMALTEPGDKVLVQTPVYNCFFSSIRNNNCEILTSDLLYSDGKYTMDFDDLDTKASDPGCKVLLLCNPHNPVGRAWTQKELERIGEICFRNNVLVISDEIHCDLVFPGHTHIPFASLGKEYSDHSVTCSSPSKSFNLAGLQVASIFAADLEIRQKIDRALNINEVCEINPFAIEGLIAAYTHEDSESWLDSLKGYIWENYLFVKDFFARNFPGLTVLPLEATYLVWIDCSILNMLSEKLAEFILERGNLRINEGTIYGNPGKGFIRLNIACPLSVLEEGLNRMKKALDQVQ